MEYLDQSCRISVVASSLERGAEFIQSLKTLESTITEGPMEISECLQDQSNSPHATLFVPWSTSNRYYSADVHFAAHTIQGLSSHHVDKVPAVILVWSQGEPYERYARDLAHLLKGHDPEVSLAVKVLPKMPVSTVATHGAAEDNIAIDTTLMSYGFEYIDATCVPSSEHIGREEGTDSESLSEDGIPRLPRVLDALSTIMWPSMTRRQTMKVPEVVQPNGYRGRYSSLDEIIAHDPAGLLSVLEDLSDLGGSNNQDTFRGSAIKPLTGGDWQSWDINGLPSADPWESSTISGPFIMSSSEMPTLSPFEMQGMAPESGKYKGVGAFDDDFSTFVTSPALSTNDANIQGDSGRFPPTQEHWSSWLSHEDSRYRSLSPVSDFGGNEDEKTQSPRDRGQDLVDIGDDDDQDIGLPSRGEVRQITMKLFDQAGIQAPPAPALGQTRKNGAASVSVTVDAFKSTSPTSNIRQLDNAAILEKDTRFDGEEEGREDPYGLASFDLTQVLSALQQFKSEIAAIDNEGERQKAAARVALGLVYGLEGNAEA